MHLAVVTQHSPIDQTWTWDETHLRVVFDLGLAFVEGYWYQTDVLGQSSYRRCMSHSYIYHACSCIPLGSADHVTNCVSESEDSHL